jgi:hypothetical protein
VRTFGALSYVRGSRAANNDRVAVRSEVREFVIAIATSFFKSPVNPITNLNPVSTTKLNSVALLRKRPPFVGEVSANFRG